MKLAGCLVCGLASGVRRDAYSIEVAVSVALSVGQMPHAEAALCAIHDAMVTASHMADGRARAASGDAGRPL